jgi:hypothetical protein
VRLEAGTYRPIPPESDGSLASRALGLKLVSWDGVYAGIRSRRLRWATPDGKLLPTAEEAEAEARARAEAAEQELARLRRQLEEQQRSP